MAGIDNLNIDWLIDTALKFEGTADAKLMFKAKFDSCSSCHWCSHYGRCVHLCLYNEVECTYRNHLERGTIFYGGKRQEGIIDMAQAKTAYSEVSGIKVKYVRGKNKDSKFVYLVFFKFDNKYMFMHSVVVKTAKTKEQLDAYILRKLTEDNSERTDNNS